MFKLVSSERITSESGKNKFTRYQRKGDYQIIGLAQLSSLDEVITIDKEILINFPGLPCPASFTFSGGLNGTADYGWYGIGTEATKENPCGAEEFFYYKRDGLVSGYFTIDTVDYQFMPIEDDLVVLFTHTDNGEIKKRCGIGDHSPGATSLSPLLSKTMSVNKSNSPCLTEGRVSILVLYTPAAERESPDIVAQANLAMGTLRQALINTGTNSGDLNVSLAAAIELFDFVESDNIGNDVEILNDQLIAIRNTHRADAVIVLTGDAYGANGSVEAVNFNLDPDLFTAIVEHNHAVIDKTFAHEFAHIAGASHDETTNQNVGFEKGYVFRTKWWPLGRKMGTILAVSKPIRDDYENRLILSFSNPDRRYRRKAIGARDNDVHRWFEENGNSVALFNPSNDIRLIVRVTGDQIICPGQSRWYRSDVSCADGEVSYRWEFSTDNVNFNTVSTSPDYYYTAPNVTENTFENLRLTVTDDNGSAVTGTVPYVIPQHPDCISKQLNAGNEPKEFASVTSSINAVTFPNPVRTGDKLSVNTGSISSGGISTVVLYDSQMKRQVANPEFLGKIVRLDTDQCRPGVHIVVCRNAQGDVTLVSKVVILP